MKLKELIKRVQDEAAVATPDEATAVLGAVLGTLGEMLSPTERRHLASQMPKPLKDYVARWVGRPPGEMSARRRFGLEEFYHRVSTRADIGYPTAVKRTQAVMKVLRDAVPQGELADLSRDLPQEYDELLTGTPTSPVSPSIVE